MKYRIYCLHSSIIFHSLSFLPDNPWLFHCNNLYILLFIVVSRKILIYSITFSTVLIYLKLFKNLHSFFSNFFLFSLESTSESTETSITDIVFVVSQDYFWLSSSLLYRYFLVTLALVMSFLSFTYRIYRYGDDFSSSPPRRATAFFGRYILFFFPARSAKLLLPPLPS